MRKKVELLGLQDERECLVNRREPIVYDKIRILSGAAAHRPGLPYLVQVQVQYVACGVRSGRNYQGQPHRNCELY